MYRLVIQKCSLRLLLATLKVQLLNNGDKVQNTMKEDSKGGRPEKDDTQKSDKTLANKESMSWGGVIWIRV